MFVDLTVYQKVGMAPTREKIAFLNKKRKELEKDTERTQVLPTRKMYSAYIADTAECLMYPDQGGIKFDVDDIYLMFLERYGKEPFTSSVEYLAVLTEVMNEYFGENIPSKSEYRAFTRDKYLKLSDFKGKNLASGFERAIVTHNLNKLLGIESYLAFTSCGPLVIYRATSVEKEDGYIFFNPSCYSYRHHPNEKSRVCPSAAMAHDDLFYNFVHTQGQFTSNAYTMMQSTIGPEYTIEKKDGFNFEFEGLGIPREQTYFR
ncbi:MAG: hypothetical protein IJ301_00090 [Clostridia bacterium]|nr:hypothetical protein [Clostridia bacterium]